MGVNTIGGLVKKLMGNSGISGKWTNQGLRAGAATTLHRSGVDEQTIKGITGHRSDAVRAYKRPCARLVREAHAILAGEEPSSEPVEKKAKMVSLSDFQQPKSKVSKPSNVPPELKLLQKYPCNSGKPFHSVECQENKTVDCVGHLEGAFHGVLESQAVKKISFTFK